MLIDAAIILIAIGSFIYGRDIGFIRNFSSALGFFLGFFIGFRLQNYFIDTPNGSMAQALATIFGAFILGIIFLTIGEYIGIKLKHKLIRKRNIQADKYLGSIFSLSVLVFCVWLSTALTISLPFPGLQQQADNSRIINAINGIFTPAAVVTDRLASGLSGRTDYSAEYKQYTKSVYKIVNQACGQVKVGSGFQVGPDLIATNAHVVAGAKNPLIQTAKQILSSEVVYLDGDLDFALLRTAGLNGMALGLDPAIKNNDTAIESIGFSGGGPMRMKSGKIIKQLMARTENIYKDSLIKRPIYEINSYVELGDSGGPVISGDKVVGMAFAESTTIPGKGYALMTKSFYQITQAANQKNINLPVDNKKCT